MVKFFRDCLGGRTSEEFNRFAVGEINYISFGGLEGGPGLLDDEGNWVKFGRLEGRSPDLWMMRGIS